LYSPPIAISQRQIYRHYKNEKGNGKNRIEEGRGGAAGVEKNEDEWNGEEQRSWTAEKIRREQRRQHDATG